MHNFTNRPQKQAYKPKCSKNTSSAIYRKINQLSQYTTSCQCAVLLLSILALFTVANCGPVVTTSSQAEIYLSQFGYLPASSRNPTGGRLLDANTWNKAVEDFQSFAGLNVTGELDAETMELMSLPRCGVKDKVGSSENSRSKRYALQGSRWRVKALTYRISKYPKRLRSADVDAEIARAFAVWSDYTDLSFTPKRSGPVHIEIKFVEGEHGDGDSFDGTGGTLAHAFFPVFGGDAHFDDAEVWTIGSSRGTNLFQVAAHEFGHSLGLSHSDERSALMAPFYRGFDPVFKLDYDDISAIQALYGKKTKSTAGVSPRTTQKPTIPQIPRDDAICKDPSIDAMFNSAEGFTYALKGQYYYRLTENAIADGYPKPISEGWPGLPGDIDAAFTYKNGKTYFFKGTKYWRYNGRLMDGQYPKEISDGFTGIPDHLDAAMVWGGNGKIYFFKGSKFWRFDPLKRPPVKSSYPKPISNWEGLPNNLNAALQYTNGYTYFFKDDKYYRFNDNHFAVDAADPPFPRPVGHWWFGCKSNPQSTTGNFVEKTGEHSYSNKYSSYNDAIDESLLYDAAEEHQAHDHGSDTEISGQRQTGNSADNLDAQNTFTILAGSLLLWSITKLFSS